MMFRGKTLESITPNIPLTERLELWLDELNPLSYQSMEIVCSVCPIGLTHGSIQSNFLKEGDLKTILDVFE